VGLCSAIYSCSNGEVEKHICGFKCMTIRPLHLDINSEVFYVNNNINPRTAGVGANLHPLVFIEFFCDPCEF